jgi:hypothetical protein
MRWMENIACIKVIANVGNVLGPETESGISLGRCFLRGMTLELKKVCLRVWALSGFEQGPLGLC